MTIHAVQRCDWCYIFQRALATLSLEGKLSGLVLGVHAKLRLLAFDGTADHHSNFFVLRHKDQSNWNISSFSCYNAVITIWNEHQSIERNTDAPPVGYPFLNDLLLSLQMWEKNIICFFLSLSLSLTELKQLRQIIACWAVCALTNPQQMPAWCWLKDCDGEKFTNCKNDWLTDSHLKFRHSRPFAVTMS